VGIPAALRVVAMGLAAADMTLRLLALQLGALCGQ
jgi:hypothetical protein